MALEINFDGLVGPTHNYAGLALGNFASATNKGLTSNPKQAALQGLKKAKSLADLGVKQAILPPNPRPNLALLLEHGFSGTDSEVITQAYKQAPDLLAAAYSAASMWAANIATVSPSANSKDGRVHLTVANSAANLHRAQEASFNYTVLKKIFSDEKTFCVHKALATNGLYFDEGEANHGVICSEYGKSGIELFVYGDKGNAKKIAVRQSLAASQQVASTHQLSLNKTIFSQQNPQAIQQGVFHNDVAFVNNKNVMFFHELAFAGGTKDIEKLRQACDFELISIEIKEKDLSLAEAVATYLFNSQIVSINDKNNPTSMALIAPQECRYNLKTMKILDKIISAVSNPIDEIYFVDCKQSMLNGGGPACLRLRVILTEDELAKLNPKILLTDQLYKSLVAWVETYYRYSLSLQDLADIKLYEESIVALAELDDILS